MAKRDTLEGRRQQWAEDQAKTKGSMKDSTWDRKKKIHVCCGSKRGIRHLVKCKNAIVNCDDDYSDLKDL